MDINKKKMLDSAVSALDKKYGKGSLMLLGDRPKIKMPVISTGSLQLNKALGIGGLPKGRIIEIYGPESSGKTTLALHVIAEAQKAGGIAGFIDAEHALDPQYAQKLGVNIDDLYISQPDNGEQALEITEALVRSGALDVLVIDSVAALVPRAEIEGDMGDSHMGLQARLMSQALRKLTGVVNKSNCVVIFINQLREKVGITFGSNETTTGGRALKFYATIRIDVRRIGQIKNGGDIIGNETKFKVVKNKVAPPFREALTAILYGKGIDTIGEIIDLGVESEILNKAGAWYSYGDIRFQGKERFKEALDANNELLKEIETKVVTAVMASIDAQPLTDEEDGDEDPLLSE